MQSEDLPISRRQLNFVCAGTPLAMSILALALVVIAMVSGAGRGSGGGEGAGAHLFQLLIVLQAPIIAGFLISSDWRRPLEPLRAFALQVMAILAAFGALYLSGL
jgi:hypothetical protein